ncbi:JDVT-CTERM system CAAX-type protease [Geovibrio thiophilus]|uniref:JDVT-CTERM system CAAX-type protease n=1 Tax=Geovibrio thiophilus TaxID=139438 RepID=A0A3R5X4I3_9BACT|nr:JDVT-CTERM system glutamic-type intramembrane protease [Geovibrio thiophilus]QAR34244.1 JDVT-CTERM system CAAX-type protease [Geovibrio thiophilus]
MERKNIILLTAFSLGAAYFGARILFLGGSFVFDSSKVLRYLLLAPVAEELFFRGVMQEWLERLKLPSLYAVSSANIAVSVVFAVFHLWGGESLHAFLVFFPSVVFGCLYSEYRSVLPCVLCHAFYNLNVMIV